MTASDLRPFANTHAGQKRVRPKRLSRAALPADTITLARWLIGRIVVRRTADGAASGRIVETEAYLHQHDAAAHSYRGETPRNRSLFLQRGHAYVYLAYGTSYMLNVSSQGPGTGAGVLIRALEPLTGLDLMARRRGTDRLRDLCRGPGRLAQALSIDLRLDGCDLCKPGPLWLAQDETSVGPLGMSARIGITRNAESLLRFYLKGSAFLSGPKALSP
jgi:DNA-3-methyladenine glycosylase